MSHHYELSQLPESDLRELATAILTRLGEFALSNSNPNQARELKQLSHDLAGTASITTPDPEDEYAGINPHPYSYAGDII